MCSPNLVVVLGIVSMKNCASEEIFSHLRKNWGNVWLHHLSRKALGNKATMHCRCVLADINGLIRKSGPMHIMQGS